MGSATPELMILVAIRKQTEQASMQHPSVDLSSFCPPPLSVSVPTHPVPAPTSLDDGYGYAVSTAGLGAVPGHGDIRLSAISSSQHSASDSNCGLLAPFTAFNSYRPCDSAQVS
ncbi:hypothetical protein STEG23_008872 [Scotinomys teguina]